LRPPFFSDIALFRAKPSWLFYHVSFVVFFFAVCKNRLSFFKRGRDLFPQETSHPLFFLARFFRWSAFFRFSGGFSRDRPLPPLLLVVVTEDIILNPLPPIFLPLRNRVSANSFFFLFLVKGLPSGITSLSLSNLILLPFFFMRRMRGSPSRRLLGLPILPIFPRSIFSAEVALGFFGLLFCRLLYCWRAKIPLFFTKKGGARSFFPFSGGVSRETFFLWYQVMLTSKKSGRLFRMEGKIGFFPRKVNLFLPEEVGFELLVRFFKPIPGLFSGARFFMDVEEVTI